MDEADLEDGMAVPGPLGGNRSLRSLPGGRLWLALGFGDSPLAGLISPTDLEKRALAAVQRIEAELDAKIQDDVERYLSMMEN